MVLRSFFRDGKSLTPAQVRARYHAGDVLLDVRTGAEYTFGHLEGALNLDITARGFDEELGAFDRTQAYYVYCSSGRRASAALRRMRKRGFRRVYHAGSLDSLACAGFPLSLPHTQTPAS